MLDGSTFVGKLTVTLDGWQKQELILDYPASLPRNPQSGQPFLCVGDARHAATKSLTGAWSLAQVRVFRYLELFAYLLVFTHLNDLLEWLSNC